MYIYEKLEKLNRVPYPDPWTHDPLPPPRLKLNYFYSASLNGRTQNGLRLGKGVPGSNTVSAPVGTW